MTGRDPDGDGDGDERPPDQVEVGAVSDPVDVRRSQLRRLARAGQRVGMTCYAIATIALIVGLATGFGEVHASVATVGLVAGSAILAPAILLLYMIKAALRDEAEGEGHRRR